MAATLVAFFFVAASSWASVCDASCVLHPLHQAGHTVEPAPSGMSAEANMDMAGERMDQNIDQKMDQRMDHSCCPMQNGETSLSAPHHQMSWYCADVASARSQLQSPASHAVASAGIALAQYTAAAALAAETPPLSPPNPVLYDPVVSARQSVLRI